MSKNDLLLTTESEVPIKEKERKITVSSNGIVIFERIIDFCGICPCENGTYCWLALQMDRSLVETSAYGIPEGCPLNEARLKEILYRPSNKEAEN